MNVLLSPQPSFFPHQRESPRLSPPRSQSPYNMSARKRKAEDDEMSVSPHSSPAIASRQLARPSKKVRAGTDLIGRPLTLPRLLETLEKDQLRAVLQTICERHPDIGQEVVNGAPRPTPAKAIEVLGDYQKRLRDTLPVGHDGSEYTYFRVRQPLSALVEAISDITPQFLPPNELQPSVSLEFLDGATTVIHELPDWDAQQNRHHKDNAYEEIGRAWALVITEAAKRAGGFVFHTSGWDRASVALAKHNQQSGGRLEQAMTAMANSGWPAPNSASQPGGPSEPSILDQIIGGTYGSPVRVGPW